MHGFDYLIIVTIGSIFASNIINEDKECNKFINNIVTQSLDKNNGLEIKNSTSLNKNKRVYDDNEPLNLSIKFKVLEKIPKIVRYNTTNLLIQEECSNSNAINFDETFIKKLVSLNFFEYIFGIIEKDLINILNIYCTYSDLENGFIFNTISQLEKLSLDEQKIAYFINKTNEILNLKVKDKLLNDNKNMFINKIISTNYYKKKHKKIFNSKLQRKTLQIDLHVKLKNITNGDILNITIDYINNTKDKEIQFLFINGFQSLFNIYSNKSLPRLYNILILLYAFNLENEYFEIDWHERMFNMLSLYNFNLRKSKCYYEMINISYGNDIIKSLGLYITINSKNLNLAYQKLNELIKDEINLKFFTFLIDKVNKIKCKLFGIKYDE